ncbi:hypothetical protein [Variovorax sp. GT1P44]|uniref:hypothetical protein n=1 Tax=Variovorax sp. GT1P44 TaxID=3443742 RepID=UPI003F48FBED
MLTITGPDRARYRLGDPMHLHDGKAHLGFVESVRVRPGGHEVELENFHPFSTPLRRRAQLGRVVLAEVLHFIVATFPSVQSVRVTLSSSIESFPGEGIELARIRAELLQSTGCEHVTMVPKPHARYIGHFEVSAIWTYSASSSATLDAVLRAERAAYRECEKDTMPTETSALRRMIQRLLSRRS